MLRSPRAPSGALAVASSRLRAASAQSPSAHCAVATLNSTWEPGGRWGAARTQPRSALRGPCQALVLPQARPPSHTPGLSARAPGGLVQWWSPPDPPRSPGLRPTSRPWGVRPVSPRLCARQGPFLPALHPRGLGCCLLGPVPSPHGKGLLTDTWDWGKACGDTTLPEPLPPWVPHQGLLGATCTVQSPGPGTQVGCGPAPDRPFPRPPCFWACWGYSAPVHRGPSLLGVEE